MLARHGYGVLIFDPRGTGESEGDPYRWGGERDVKAALDYLRGRPDVDPQRIGGLGLSLGGELMLQTAGETDALKAVVSEGAGIRSIREQMLKPGAAKWLSAPFWATQTAAIAVFSNHAPPPNLKELVARISPRPRVPHLLGASARRRGAEREVLRRGRASPRRSGGSPTPATPAASMPTPASTSGESIAFFDHALLPRT